MASLHVRNVDHLVRLDVDVDLLRHCLHPSRSHVSTQHCNHTRHRNGGRSRYVARERDVEWKTHPSSSFAAKNVHLDVPGPLPAPWVLRVVVRSADDVASIVLPPAPGV